MPKNAANPDAHYFDTANQIDLARHRFDQPSRSRLTWRLLQTGPGSAYRGLVRLEPGRLVEVGGGVVVVTLRGIR